VVALVTVWVVRRDRTRHALEASPRSVAPTMAVAPRPLGTGADRTPPPVAMPAGTEADPTPSDRSEVLPTARCPLSDHGFGAPPAHGRVSADWYTSPGDLQRPFSEQESAEAPLVVYVYTDWCQYCRAFERGLLTSSLVDQYLRDNAVKLRLNPETSREANALSHKLGVKGYPTFIVSVPGDTPQHVSIYGEGTQLKAPEEFIKAIEGGVSRGAEKLLQDGRRAREAGDLRESVRLLTLAIRITAGEPRAYLERGLSLAESGATDEALDDLARVTRERPDEIFAYQYADYLLGRLGRWDEVIACWTGALERNSSSGKAYLARARALGQKGLRGLSRSDADKACSLGESEGCRRVSALVGTPAR
ncbi:MAG TPA: thioredoxin family protein, partial [Vicinamibacteria bacterium]|nr:thioredoxin family protein [Vicinamibacteria bacterium]